MNENQDNKKIPSISLKHMLKASKWSWFLGIIGMICCVVLFVGGIVILATTIGGNESHVAIRTMGIIYIIVGIVFFIPLYNLFRFGRRVYTGFLNDDNLMINKSFRNLSRYFSYLSYFILLLIILILIRWILLAF
ncbi:MAG: hypothetical protein ACEPOV_03825 [Hyphomicrobiales bacterium]